MESNSIERYGYKCQNPECHHYWVLHFSVEETGREMWQYGKWHKCYTSTLLNPPAEYGDIGKMLVNPPHFWKMCPKCRKSWIKIRRIVGHINPKVPCNEDCTHAQGDKCTCSCGGANHGMAYVVDFRNTVPA